MKANRKNMAIGFVLSILVFFITAMFIFVFRYDATSGQFISNLVGTLKIFPILQLSVISNLPLFFLFLKFNKEVRAKGVMMGLVTQAMYILYVFIVS